MWPKLASRVYFKSRKKEHNSKSHTLLQGLYADDFWMAIAAHYSFTNLHNQGSICLVRRRVKSHIRLLWPPNSWGGQKKCYNDLFIEKRHEEFIINNSPALLSYSTKGRWSKRYTTASNLSFWHGEQKRNFSLENAETLSISSRSVKTPSPNRPNFKLKYGTSKDSFHLRLVCMGDYKLRHRVSWILNHMFSFSLIEILTWTGKPWKFPLTKFYFACSLSVHMPSRWPKHWHNKAMTLRNYPWTNSKVATKVNDKIFLVASKTVIQIITSQSNCSKQTKSW